jgi:hypothetical protein
MFVLNIGTFLFSTTLRPGKQAYSKASSNEKEQPNKNETRSSVQSSEMSSTSS